ncbi:fatty acyl-AMP ligase [Actinophytocola sp.]|uniref:fatty acyl-AMP ligase n=1 Tax=Actinophytocola sp. TaxID=1872138 RepID=UPI002ED10285
MLPTVAETAALPVLLRDWARRQGDERALTFVDYTRDPGGLATTLTWAELDEQVERIAAAIQPRCSTGDRVAILVEQSATYVASFLAAIRAGLIAVPLYPPGLPRFDERLAAVLADCTPALLLASSARATDVARFAGDVPVVPVDALGEPGPLLDVPHGPDDVAYLQYTSGSTRTPAGVVLTHANVFANARQAVECFELVHGRSVCVSWLPLFHDMGLMLGAAAALVAGIPVVLLDPGAFLEQPVRWLRALSANPGAITAAPSFAYAYAAARTTERDRMLLRLDGVEVLIDGSEPVAPANINRFHDTFAECGLRRAAHRPSYGLAEATVLVTSTPAGTEPRPRTFDAGALAAGTAAPPTPDRRTSTLVGCGTPAGQRVLVVDAETGVPVRDGTVGEVWVSGPNVATRYWRGTERSEHTFGGQVPGEPGRWLRTGDLGLFVDGELFITGRLKDLIIVDGRNHYPQDIEYTVEHAHPAIRRHATAAFAVSTMDGERLVVLAERARDAESMLDEEVTVAVRSAVSAEHGIGVQDLVLLDPGAVPRTSSGKISRTACRAMYLAEGGA